MVIDNNSRTYWIASTAPAYIAADMKTAVLCDGYRWYTSNTDSGSDPLNWTVDVSADGAAWFAADVRTAQSVTTARGALGAACTFSGAWPCDAAGDATVADIAAGTTLRVLLPDEAAAALTGSGTLALAGGSALRVDDSSGFTGNVSGDGQLLLGGDTALRVPSGASTLTAANDGPVPAAVTVGAAGEPLFAAALADGTSTFGFTKQGSGTLTVTDVGSTYSGDTRVEQGTLKVQAPMWRFRYVRFNTLLTLNNNAQNSGYALAMAELQLTSNGVVVAYPAGSTASAPYPSHTSGQPANAINGLIGDRWLSSVSPNPLTIDTKTGVSFNGYSWHFSGVNTADRGRAPTDWLVEGSDDDIHWMTLCAESGTVIPPGYLSNSQPGVKVGDFSARPARFTLPLEFYGETNSAALKVAAVTARYLRFTVTDTRWQSGDFGNTGFQLSELQLMRSGSPLLYPAGTVASAPADGYNDNGGRYFPPQLAVDNLLPVPGTDTNRWYSVAMVNPMTVDMGQPVTFDAYRWYTGPNGTGRDPLGWRLEISNNATNWYAVDVQTNQNVTLTRNVIAGTWALDIPAGLRAADAIPDGSRTYVASGALLRIEAGSETVGPLSGAGTVSLASTVFGINGFEDAVYTGGITGTGTVEKAGDATQTISGALSFSGTSLVEGGTLDLEGAVLTGVTNIVLLSGGTLAGAATVNGDLTVTCEGGAYRANLAVSGALNLAGDLLLALPDGVELPYQQRLFAFGSADEATRVALAAAAGTLEVPFGFAALVRVESGAAYLSVAAPGTVLMLH
jgi:autotransporter-associated beta strand protein